MTAQQIVSQLQQTAPQLRELDLRYLASFTAYLSHFFSVSRFNPTTRGFYYDPTTSVFAGENSSSELPQSEEVFDSLSRYEEVYPMHKYLSLELEQLHQLQEDGEAPAEENVDFYQKQRSKYRDLICASLQGLAILDFVKVSR